MLGQVQSHGEPPVEIMNDLTPAPVPEYAPEYALRHPRPLTEAHVRHQPMKLFARARAPLDSATSLFVEYLMQELLAQVQDLKVRGHIPETIRGQG